MPLVVGLHTWSAARDNQQDALLPLCRERGWALLLPEFRGPNLTTNPRAAEACASVAARQDIIDAVDYVCGCYPIEADAVFVVGGSGGGHMALMMAAYAPDRWRAVSAWCPITDVATWHGENAGYAPHVAACCGGLPGESPAIDAEYRERSPMTHAARIAQAHLSVHHGRRDQSVPYTQTLRLIEALETLGAERCYYEIFDGGHEIHHARGFAWFDKLMSTATPTTRLTG